MTYKVQTKIGITGADNSNDNEFAFEFKTESLLDFMEYVSKSVEFFSLQMKHMLNYEFVSLRILINEEFHRRIWVSILSNDEVVVEELSD